jgi:uncharacterized protein (TIGR03083 family)
MVDYAAELLAQNRAFAEVIRDADPTIPVPTCPGWSLQQLFRHLGRGHRWAAQIVREQRDSPLNPREVLGGKPPDDQAGALEWFGESARLVLDAVTAAGPDTPVWTFLGPRPAAWWIRRRLHEETAHRADAAIAVGVDYVLAPHVAADGISEWLDLIAAQRTDVLDPGSSLHLHATDIAAEWTVHAENGRVTWDITHRKAPAAARGRAEDLFLAMLRRRGAEDVDVQILGDNKVWATFLERTPF